MKRRPPPRWSAAALVLWGAAVAAAGLKDPTLPPPVAAPAHAARKAAPVPQVSAIFLSASRRVAIFDGKAVAAGDRVGDLSIEAVTADGVRYSDHGHSAFAPLRTPHS